MLNALFLHFGLQLCTKAAVWTKFLIIITVMTFCSRKYNVQHNVTAILYQPLWQHRKNCFCVLNDWFYFIFLWKKTWCDTNTLRFFVVFFLRPGGTLCAVLCDLESDQRRARCLPPMRCSRIHQYHMCVPISGSTCHMPECAGVMLSVCQPSHCQPPWPSVFISRSPGVAAVRSHLQ